MSVDYYDNDDEYEELIDDIANHMLADYKNDNPQYYDDMDCDDSYSAYKHVQKSDNSDLSIYAIIIHIVSSAIIFFVALFYKCVFHWTNWTEFFIFFGYLVIGLTFLGMIAICLIVFISLYFEKNGKNVKLNFQYLSWHYLLKSFQFLLYSFF